MNPVRCLLGQYGFLSDASSRLPLKKQYIMIYLHFQYVIMLYLCCKPILQHDGVIMDFVLRRIDQRHIALIQMGPAQGHKGPRRFIFIELRHVVRRKACEIGRTVETLAQLLRR